MLMFRERKLRQKGTTRPKVIQLVHGEPTLKARHSESGAYRKEKVLYPKSQCSVVEQGFELQT